MQPLTTATTTTSSSSFLSRSPPPHPPMAEQALSCTPRRPTSTAVTLHDPPPAEADKSDPETMLQIGTYVVQVPKDQIYRVPPPENAQLVEQYRNRDKNERRSPCLGCLKWILSAVLLVLLLVTVITGVILVTVRPGSPTFTVQRLSVNSSPHNATKGSRPKAECDFTMRVRNPSKGMGFSYEAGGKTVVLHKGVRIAAGTTPALVQGPKNTTTFQLVLHGSNMLLPKVIDMSLKGSKDVIPLELAAEFTVKPRVGWVKLGATSMHVTCDVRDWTSLAVVYMRVSRL
ncbi:unnamed protein product [Musa textilis]